MITMNTQPSILVLGAYGLAGRAVVARLVQRTALQVIAAGRDAAKLAASLAGYDAARVTARVFDATDAAALHVACADVAVVINAAGPFARHGDRIAEGVVAAQRAYVDCANEQVHYRRLQLQDDAARDAGVPMMTGAGAIPGLSTLLAVQLLSRYPEAHDLQLAWVQHRHAYAETGLASIMGGILDSLDDPVSLSGGEFVPLQLGAAIAEVEMPAPFGTTRMLEAPTLDALVLAGRAGLQELHTWFHLTDIPVGLMKVIRLLEPQRRPWAYRLITFFAERMNNADTANAIAQNCSPESLLQVTLQGGNTTHRHWMLFRDGACATAVLPVRFAEDYIAGKIDAQGLLTPVDCYADTDLAALAGDTLIDAQLS